MTNTEVNPLIHTFKTMTHDHVMPFYFNTDDHHSLKMECIFRLLPQKRLTALAFWDNQYCAAKLFFSKHHKKQAEKNKQSYLLLQQYHIATPKLLHECKASGGKMSILLYEYISAPTLQSIYDNEKEKPCTMVYLTQTVHEIATQHVYGLVQEDAHLNNYLVTDDPDADLPYQKKIICLDSSSFIALGAPLDLKCSLQHLALFLSQLGTSNPNLQKHLFFHYLKARGITNTPKQEKDFHHLLHTFIQSRRKTFEKKLFRKTTAFYVYTEQSWKGMIIRKDKNVLHDLILHLNSQNSLDIKMIKSGRSASVMEVQIENRKLIIKRYHMKHIWHALRRWMRASRASHQWEIAKQCELAGIRVPRAIGFAEKMRLGFQQDAIYLYEKVNGQPALDYFQHLSTLEEKKYFFKRISAYLKSLFDYQLVHGDLKITNFIIDENQNPVLIDWDGAKFYNTPFFLKRAFNKDIQRFIRNFTKSEDAKMAREVLWNFFNLNRE